MSREPRDDFIGEQLLIVSSRLITRNPKEPEFVQDRADILTGLQFDGAGERPESRFSNAFRCSVAL